MISVAKADRPLAARLAALVLLSALARALVANAGDVVAALVFVVALGAVLVFNPADRHLDDGPRWGRMPSLAAGLAMGIALSLPSLLGPGLGWRGTGGFVPWAAIAAVAATMEELVIRGRLQPALTAELGVLPSLLLSAAIFALIHLPRYGWDAMPLDLAVGLSLAGLRTVSGRTMPSAIAHVAADWAAWFAV